MPAEAPPTPRPATLIGRALRRRCPLCGSGHLFRRWFHLAPTCPGCGLRFLREQGHWTGDLGLNTIATFGTLLIVLLTGTLLTWPNTDAGRLGIAAVATVVIVPLAFFPLSKTLWLAFDLAINPLRPGELPHHDAAAAERETDDEPAGARPPGAARPDRAR